MAAERGILLKGADVLETARKASFLSQCLFARFESQSSSVHGISFLWSTQFRKNTASSMAREYLYIRRSFVEQMDEQSIGGTFYERPRVTLRRNVVAFSSIGPRSLGHRCRALPKKI